MCRRSSAYYAVENGVWFTSANPTGPWIVATTVPPAIYTIPPSSPIHYVTYVQVYGYTPSVVYVWLHARLLRHDRFLRRRCSLWHRLLLCTYTSALPLGIRRRTPTEWAPGSHGVRPPDGGWRLGMGMAMGAYCSPWWGPVGYWGWGYAAPAWGWGGYGGAAAANVYGRWGNTAYAGTRAAWANPYTGNVGTGSRGAYYNPVTGNRRFAAHAQNYNAYTGTERTGSHVSGYNPSTGNRMPVTAGQATPTPATMPRARAAPTTRTPAW